MKQRSFAGAWCAPSQLRLLGILFMLVAATAVAGWSQVVSATLLGTVTDPSGAVVPGAKVTITETQTGIVHTEQANGSGNYIVPNLPPGIYAVSVAAAGFNPHFSQIGLAKSRSFWHN
jgi:Carboxypeptidase regulatory-like domain